MTEVALLVALGPGLLQPQVVAGQIPSPSFAIPRETRKRLSKDTETASLLPHARHPVPRWCTRHWCPRE